jgi:predicted RNase H-like HicB family nuclease
MERKNIKDKFHNLIDKINNETLLMKFYDLMIKSTTGEEGKLFDQLTSEQKDILMLAEEESNDPANLISHNEQKKKHNIGMERIVTLHIEKLPEGFYLATSDQIQGLVAQGRTITETIEIARDIAKKLIEVQQDQIPKLKVIGDNFDYPLVIGL